MPTRTRPLTTRDTELLLVATLGNLNWIGDRFTREDVLARFAHYTHLDPGRGDFGMVVYDDHGPVGVGWALFLPAEDGGYGYVDDRTPELSLWISPGHRGRGLGRHLLRRVVEEARRRGAPAVSLSVEEGNPARRLYEREGFEPVPGREADGVMLRRSGEEPLEGP